MKRDPLTAREHILVGRRLSTMRNQLMQLHLALSTAYGLPMVKRVQAIERSLAKLRSALDAEVFREHPLSTNAIKGVPITRVYYGATPNSHGIDTPEQARARLHAEASALDLTGNSEEQP